MRLSDLSKRERMILSAAAVLVAVAVAYSLAVEPVMRAAGRLDREIARARGALEKDMRLLSVYKASGRPGAAATGVARSGKTVESETASILERIEDMSKSSACPITSVKPLGARAVGSYKDVSVEVTVEGDIGQIARFVYESEHSADMPMRIKRFSISAKSQAGGSLRGSFVLTRFIQS
jgi:hypothetical protein